MVLNYAVRRWERGSANKRLNFRGIVRYDREVYATIALELGTRLLCRRCENLQTLTNRAVRNPHRRRVG